jgi:alkylation response protein AidB-like acyl-CoA dehydrogenase
MNVTRAPELELMPASEAGRKFADLCEGHAAVFADRAADYDRNGVFAFENVQDLQNSGAIRATLPTQYGGLGVTSVLDLTVGINRLARGDASTAIAANMHLSAVWSLARQWQYLRDHDGHADLSAYELAFQLLGAGALICGAGSEPGTHVLFPLTKAVRTEGGWLLSGRKNFVSLSPVVDAFNVLCQVQHDDGNRWTAAALVIRDTEGLELKENWDGLGMRASGSHELILSNCFVPEDRLTKVGPWGEWTSAYLAGASAGNAALVGAFLGIAETARDYAINLLRTRRKGPSDRLLAERPALQHAVGKAEIDLSSCRAVLERCCRQWDEYLTRTEPDQIQLDHAHQLMKELQCTKTFVNKGAIDIVDVAMTVSGGSGYVSSNILSRLYRDVRSGPFMQPFSPNEAFEYIGKVVLGLPPDVE